jgi:hypothetical protein
MGTGVRRVDPILFCRSGGAGVSQTPAQQIDRFLRLDLSEIEGWVTRSAWRARRHGSHHALAPLTPSLDSSTLAHKIESRAGFGTLRTLWRLRFRTSVPVLA